MTADCPESRSRSPKFPLSVREGSVEVKVYATPFDLRGTKYSQYSVCYYLGTRRVRERFSDLDKAKAAARAAAVKLANAELDAFELSASDRSIFAHCTRILEEVGTPLAVAVAEYVESRRLLPPGTTLKDAVAEHVGRRAKLQGDARVPVLVEEFIAAKLKAGLSKRHLTDLRHRLGRFSRHFDLPVGNLTAALIEKYLDDLGVAGRSRINDLTCISAFGRYAVKVRQAPRDLLEEIGALQRPKLEPPATLIWSPSEFLEMLDCAPPAAVSFLVLGGLCGLRSSEILRADWSHLTPDGSHIAVITRKGRSPSRRLVPLGELAKSQLDRVNRGKGPICEYTREQYVIRAIIAAVNEVRARSKNPEKFLWRENALRHSYGTYRVALTGDVSRTSLEMGNSPSMIVKHYLQLVTKQDADRFFDLSKRRAPTQRVEPVPVAAASPPPHVE